MKPRVIPEELATDRATLRLVTAWIHHHQRYQICTKRLNWKTQDARDIEKKRRREKWRKLAQILEIQRTLLNWLAKATKHPELFTSKNPDRPESILRALEREYRQNRRFCHNAAGAARKTAMSRRTTIVKEKRDIERAWMVALCEAIDPKLSIPKPLQLHPRELYPRKLSKAQRELIRELI